MAKTGDGEDLGTAEGYRRIAADADTCQDVVWSTPPVAAVAIRARSSVENWAKASEGRESLSETGVPGGEHPFFFRSETRHGRIEQVRIVRRRGEKEVTCGDCEQRSRRQEHGDALLASHKIHCVNHLGVI